MFEQASRLKLRYDTPRGFVSVEDLWDISLTNRNGFSLNDIAKTVNKGLKLANEESFVEDNPGDEREELKLDIVKHVIAVKLKEVQEEKDKVERKATKQKILGLIGEKQDEKLKGQSIAKLKAMLEDL